MSRTIVYADVNIILDFQKHIKMLQWFAKNNKRYLPKGETIMQRYRVVL